MRAASHLLKDDSSSPEGRSLGVRLNFLALVSLPFSSLDLNRHGVANHIIIEVSTPSCQPAILKGEWRRNYWGRVVGVGVVGVGPESGFCGWNHVHRNCRMFTRQ